MTTAARLRSIEIERVDAGDRLRPVDAAYAEVIAASMGQIGLTEPITVRTHVEKPGMYRLVAGAHRFYAAKIFLAWTEIDAIVTDLDDAEARLVEIDENLMRRELGALDRAIFLAERKRVWEELHPQTAKGGNQKEKQKQRSEQNDILSFSSDVAERTGLSRRTVQRSIALAESLSSQAIEALRGTYLEDHAADLEKLSAMKPAEQIASLARLREGSVRRLADLRPAERLPADEAHFKSLMEAWTRSGEKARRRFLREIGAEHTARAAKAGLHLVDDAEGVAAVAGRRA